MAHFINKSKSEIGEPPYEMRYRGRQTNEPVLMRVIDYKSNQINEATLKEFVRANNYKNTNTTTWLNVDGLKDSSLV